MTQPPPDWRSVAHRPAPRLATPPMAAAPAKTAWGIALILFATQLAVFSAFVHYNPRAPDDIWRSWASEYLNLAYFALPCAAAVLLLNRSRGPFPLAVVLSLFAVILAVLIFATLDRPSDIPERVALFVAGNLFQVMLFVVPLVLTAWAGIRLSPLARLGVALGLALGLAVGILAGEPTRNQVEGAFIFFLPAWGVIVVTGTARHEWTRSQILGLILASTIVWRSLYGNLRVIPQVFTSAGTVRPATPVIDFYQNVAYKFQYDVLLVLIGVALAFGTLPWLQKRAEGWADVRRVLDRLGMGVKRTVPIDVGFGATLVLAIFLGGIASEWLINQVLGAIGGPTVRGVGADFSRVFDYMTPDLAILLALAAGIGEEVVFRGVLLSYFQRAFQVAFPGRGWLALGLAIVVQAVLFGVVHAGYANPIYLVAPFLFGLVMAASVRLFGFLSAVYAHSAYDFIAFSSDVARNFPPWEAVLLVFIYANLLVAVFVPAWVFVTWYLRRMGASQPT